MNRVISLTLGVFLLSSVAAWAEPDCVSKDLLPAARKAMSGFMMDCPAPVPDHPGLQRAAFMCAGLPVPVILHNQQWDWGDCTARAVRDWIWMREMTGDRDTGREMEAGQKAALLWILTPDDGMACVPDKSRPEEDIYHYQMWDQGRTLRALVLWWQVEEDAAAKDKLKIHIDKMIEGLSRLADRGEDPTYGKYAVYTYDFYEGEKRGNDINCPRGGQLIEPLAVYYSLTKRDKDRLFLDELVAGVLGNFESDNPYLTFGSGGRFDGHFHAHVSTALGIARYGKYLYERGECEKGMKLLRWAKAVYDWTRDPNNLNAGSTWGWFPENMGVGNNQCREVSETCCVADMIEFAHVLAECSRLTPDLAGWDTHWDDVERYTINYMIHAQFFPTSKYEEILKQVIANRRAAAATQPGGENLPSVEEQFEQAMVDARRMRGSWISCVLPNDKVTISEGGEPLFYTGGCCAYSGPRGIYACWNAVYTDDADQKRLAINLPVNRHDELLEQTVTEGPEYVHQDIDLKAGRAVRVRLPDWADLNAVRVGDGQGQAIKTAADGRWLVLGERPADTRIEIRYPLVDRQTTEAIGGTGNGLLFSQPDQKVTYHIHWRGNRVTHEQPVGQRIAIWPAPQAD